MNWHQLRNQYPKKWLLVEAIRAHSEQGQRVLDELAVVRTFDDSAEAMYDYQALHHEAPGRELYVVHTDRTTLEITERRWLGVRGLQ
jgi:hypothetical protein